MIRLCAQTACTPNCYVMKVVSVPNKGQGEKGGEEEADVGVKKVVSVLYSAA